jgi:hypothetical protein
MPNCLGYHGSANAASLGDSSSKDVFEFTLNFSVKHRTLVLGLPPNVGTVATIKVMGIEGDKYANNDSQKQQVLHRTKLSSQMLTES